ncbi:MAG: tRNA guanosine(34) transglycosylase Tgt, partial [Treponemataceae bacterium]
TNATVKAITRDDLEEIGFEIILSNTYHLYLRPGTDVIGKAGGLHEWSRWRRNILTDSGGFQVFSLSPFRKITDVGVKFRSHIDGSYHMLTPEKIVEIQTILRSDIQMQLDVCTSWGTEFKEAEKALRITEDWLKRAKNAHANGPDDYKGQLFGIVQGNFFKELRTRSVQALIDIDTPGIAIGGLSVGEPFEVFAEFLEHTSALLPENKPRYVMGIGTPKYILEAIENGIDMFDCVFPTRIARNGMVFTHRGNLTLKKEMNTFDMGPIDIECSCKVCKEYSRSYLRHLYKSSEILVSMLATYHNLYFLHHLVLEAREAILQNRFKQFKKAFLEKYGEGLT